MSGMQIQNNNVNRQQYDNAFQNGGQTGGAQQAGGPQEILSLTGNLVIDVMTGRAESMANWDQNVRDAELEKAHQIIAGYTDRQVQDLEKLLAILGLDGDNAKDATMATVFKSVLDMVKAQQALSAGKGSMAPADMAALDSLKESLQEMYPGDENAQLVGKNIDRMHELEAEIREYQDKGVTFDENNPPKDPPEGEDNDSFQLYTRIRELGDRIADVNYYIDKLGTDKLDTALGTNALSMKEQIKGTLATFKENSKNGWGFQVVQNYSASGCRTIANLANVLNSPDIALGKDCAVDKHALIALLEGLLDQAVEEKSDAKMLEEKMEKMLLEIQAQLDEVDSAQIQQPV